MTIFAWCAAIALGIVLVIGIIMMIVGFIKFVCKAFDTWFIKENPYVYGTIVGKYKSTKRAPFGFFSLPVGTAYTFDIKVHGDTDPFDVNRRTYNSMNIGSRIQVGVVCGRFSQRFYIRTIYL